MTPAWLLRYTPGSFRGVGFLTENHEAQGGKRVALHEYPQRDEPWAEALGRKARRWSITCFVIGDDYMSARDALIDALEGKGSGTLVHPYLGQRDAMVEDYRVAESTEEGGIARFTIEFVEPGRLLAGDVSVDSGARAAAIADTVGSAAPVRFAAKFSLKDMPSFVEQGAAGLIGRFAGSAQNAARLLGGAGKHLHAFEAGLRLLHGAETLARVPIELARTVRGLIRSVAGLGSLPLLRLRALRRLIGEAHGQRAVFGNTPVRIQERANAQAFAHLVIELAAAEGVRTAAEISFASHEDAVSLRDGFAAELDAAALRAADLGDDGVADALDELRLAMVRDLTTRGATLARVYGYTPRQTEAALVIANRLYGFGDVAQRADEIVARNRIAHPGFVAGGVLLEVLTAAQLGEVRGG